MVIPTNSDGTLRYDYAIIVPANGIARGRSYNQRCRLRWLTWCLDLHEQANGIDAAHAALKMYDQTLSPDDPYLPDNGRRTSILFEAHGVDPFHVRTMFQVGGQLCTYNGKRLEQLCEYSVDFRRHNHLAAFVGGEPSIAWRHGMMK